MDSRSKRQLYESSTSSFDAYFNFKSPHYHLEASLQLRLLNRDAHRIILTGTGIQYFERCEALFNEFQSISTDLLKEKHEASGKIRITAPANMTHKWLGKILNNFLCEYPNVNIDLTLSDKNIVCSQIIPGGVFSIGLIPNDHDKEVLPLSPNKTVLGGTNGASYEPF